MPPPPPTPLQALLSRALAALALASTCAIGGASARHIGSAVDLDKLRALDICVTRTDGRHPAPAVPAP